MCVRMRMYMYTYLRTYTAQTVNRQYRKQNNLQSPPRVP